MGSRVTKAGKSFPSRTLATLYAFMTVMVASLPRLRLSAHAGCSFSLGRPSSVGRASCRGVPCGGSGSFGLKRSVDRRVESSAHSSGPWAGGDDGWCGSLARRGHTCERKQPLTRPATAGESTVAGHPLPKGEGYLRELPPQVSSRKGEGYLRELPPQVSSRKGEGYLRELPPRVSSRRCGERSAPRERAVAPITRLEV